MSDERNRRLLEWLEDKAFLGNWTFNMENLVQAIEDAYRNLENLRNVVISLLEQLQVAESRALRMLPYLILERAFAFANTRAPLPYLRGGRHNLDSSVLLQHVVVVGHGGGRVWHWSSLATKL
jgi:hypothetical protein